MKITEIVKNNLRNAKMSKMLFESIGKIDFGGNSYQMVVDTTESPTKQGVRIKFKPLTSLVRSSKQDVASQLQEKINQSLSSTGLMVDSDSDVLDENTIGFILSVSHIQNLIEKAFTNDKTTPNENSEEDI